MIEHFINGIGIWAETDRFIREVMVDEEYKYLFDYETVVDVGANIGTFSFWIYPHAKHIWAIEPNPRAMALLVKTIEDNKLDKINTVLAAVSGRDGESLLMHTDDTHHDYGSGKVNDREGERTITYAIDTFMSRNNIVDIDLLKVDIEGLESELFESEGFKRACGHIGTIIGEYHDGGVNEHILKLLNGYGYKYEDKTNAGSSGHFIARKK